VDQLLQDLSPVNGDPDPKDLPYDLGARQVSCSSWCGGESLRLV
jgi:hypothetical protein